MPEAVSIWIVDALLMAGAEAATVIMVADFLATYGAVVMLAGGLAYSSVKARQAAQQAKDQYNASQVDRMITVASAISPRDLVLGRVRKAGTIIYRASTGEFQKDLYMAIAYAGHEVDAFEEIYLNDAKVVLDGSGNVIAYADGTDCPYAVTTTSSVTESTGSGYTVTLPSNYVVGSVTGVRRNDKSLDSTPITVSGFTATSGFTSTSISYQTAESDSKVKITKHLGQSGQTVNADLLAAFPTEWPATNVCAGVAYLVCKFTYNETAFPTGLPNVTAVIRGAKIYDPRTSTTVWSENPALMMRHVYQHSKFGKATVTSTEDARFISAANACDTDTAWPLIGWITWHAPLYRAAIVAPFGTAAKSLFDDLSQAMGGSWAFAGGEIYIKPGVYVAPVMSLTDADLAVVKRTGASESQNPISISVHRDRASKFNTVKASIWDTSADYKQTVLSPLTGASLIARDGVELVQEISMPAVGYAPQALHISGIIMRDARDPLTVDIPFKLSAYPLELFDTVSLTLSRYGWSSKQFMVLGRVWNADGSIQITLKETAAAITQMDSVFSAQGYASNTNLPTPWKVASVGALTITSGTAELMAQADGTIVSRMRVSWTQVADAGVVQNGQIEVQYRQADSSGAWTSLVVPGNETTVVTSEVVDLSSYIVRARARTSVAVGDWSQQVWSQVIGKTDLPVNVAGLAATGTNSSIILTWTDSTDADYASTTIKYGASWAAGTTIFIGAANTFTWSGPASGTYQFWAKHQDTSGNSSLTAATVGLTFALISSAPLAVLSNRAVTFAGPASGYSGITFTTGSCLVTAWIGSTQLTYGSSGANTFSCTNSSSGVTVAGGSGSGSTFTVPAPTAMSADNATTDVVVTMRDSAGTALPTQTARITYALARSGAAGTSSKSITICAFRWSNSGAGSYSQGFTYTWSGGGVSAYPSLWAAAAPASPGTGYTLYQINLIITDVSTASTTAADWGSATLNSIGYRQDGSIGNPGQSARTAYVVNTSGTVPGAVTAGSGDVIPTSSAGTWSFTATSTLSAGQYMYQVDGLYTSGANITWGNPYLSNLKVGSLSAISADLGVVNISTSGNLHSGKTSYSDTTSGFFLGNDSGTSRLAIGDASSHMTWSGSNLEATGLTVKNSGGAILLSSGSVPSDILNSALRMDGGMLNSNYGAWASTLPDNWSGWSGTPAKETTIVRNAINAVRWTVSGLTGMQQWYDFHSTPAPENTTVTLEWDGYVVANYGGTGGPSCMVRLWTNSALTTCQDTLIPITNKTTSGWQTMVGTAVVPAGSRIYGITLYQFASYNGMVDSNWADGGVVIFGNSRLSFSNKITASNASTYIADLAVDTLQIAGHSITFPAYITTTGYDLSTTTYNIPSYSGDTTPYDVYILVTFRANQGGWFYIAVDGTTVASLNPSGATDTAMSVVTTMTPNTNHTVAFSRTVYTGISGATMFILATKK